MKWIIPIVLALAPWKAQSMIMEAKNWRDISEMIKEKSVLLVTDLDDTLIRPEGYLGSVKWGEDTVNELMAHGFSKKDAVKAEIILFRHVHKWISVKTLDPETSSIISDLQKNDIPVIGLTARPPEDRDYTHKQMASVGINFLNHLSVPKESLNIFLEEPGFYDKGIIFAGGFNLKSKALEYFLKSFDLKPELIVFVDDKRHHVEDVHRGMTEFKIPCLGSHFLGN